MSYIPAALRRAGYTFHSPACSHTRGFTGLPLDQQQDLQSGVGSLLPQGAVRPICELLPWSASSRDATLASMMSLDSRACWLDRLAGCELQHGHHLAAERLARQAAALRGWM